MKTVGDTKWPIGAMRHRVTFEAPQLPPERTDKGEARQSWSEVVSLACSFSELAGRELMQAQQIAAEITTQIVIRYDGRVNAKCRAKVKEKIYYIESVRNMDTDSRFMEVLCRAQP